MPAAAQSSMSLLRTFRKRLGLNQTQVAGRGIPPREPVFLTILRKICGR